MLNKKSREILDLKATNDEVSKKLLDVIHDHSVERENRLKLLAETPTVPPATNKLYPGTDASEEVNVGNNDDNVSETSSVNANGRVMY